MSKISQYSTVTTIQKDDLLVTVDVHDTTMAGSGTTKKVQLQQLAIPVGISPSTMMFPAYIYPNPLTPWTTLYGYYPTVKYIIANASSGPGTMVDSYYATAIADALAAGVTVLGYVNTGDGAVSTATVQTQIAAWNSLYGVTSIFFDNAATSTGELGYYATVCGYVHASAGAIAVLNHGTIPDPGYAALGDILVVFESPYSSWAAFTPPAWFSQYQPAKFACFVYNVIGPGQMAKTITQAQQYGIGAILVTDEADDNFSALPTYLAAEIAQLAAPLTGYAATGGATFFGPVVIEGTGNVLVASSDGTATSNGAFVVHTAASGETLWAGIYDTATSKYFGISPQLPSPSGTVTIGGFYSGMGIHGTTNGGTSPVWVVQNSGQSGYGLGSAALTVEDGNQLYSYKNTLDDGSGNMTTLGAVRVQQSGDTNPRFQAANTGNLSWGPGNGATDCTLIRANVGYLETQGAFQVDGNLIVIGNIETTAGTITAGPVTPLNSNWDFESGTSPWSGGSGATISQSTAWAWHGTHSLLVTPDGATAQSQALSEATIPVSGSTDYTTSAVVYSANGWPAASGGVQVGINWWTSGNSYISTSFGYSGSMPLPAGQAVQVSCTDTSPSNAAYGEIFIQLNNTPPAAVTFAVDDAAFYAGTVSAGKFLRSDSVNTFLSPLTAADLPANVTTPVAFSGNGVSNFPYGHYYGAVTASDITVQPNTVLSQSASMFLDNNAITPVNQHGTTSVTSGTTTFATASKTPGVIGCLALAAATTDATETLSSVSAGWTSDLTENGNYHSTYAAHKNALTADTSTAISNTFTFGASSLGASEILLIAPSAGGSPSVTQSTGSACQTGSPVAFTLTSYPNPGDLLVAFISYSQYAGLNHINPPAGWVQVDAVTGGSTGTYGQNDALATFYRVAQAGDGKSYSFGQANYGDYASGVLYDVQQAETYPQVWEFFCNSAGQFGVFDKTSSYQPVTIVPNGGIGLSAAGSLTLSSGNSADITLAPAADLVFSQGNFRCQVLANFQSGIQNNYKSLNHAASPYSVAATGDYVLGCDPTAGTITVNLPNVGWAGQTYIIKDETGQAATHNITVNGNGGQNIDGSASSVISSNYGVLRIYSTGSGWSAW